MRLAFELGPVLARVRDGESSPSEGAVEPSGPRQGRHLRVLPDQGFPPQEAAHGGRTLQELLSGAWEDLMSHRAAACPICDGAMAPRYGAGPSPVGGRCRDCGAEFA